MFTITNKIKIKINKYISLLLLIALNISSLIQAQVYLGQSELRNSRLLLHNDTIEVHLSRNGLGLVNYYKMDLTKDTLMFDSLKLHVLVSERHGIDSVFNNVHLVISGDSLIMLGTNYIFLIEKEHYRRIEVERNKPWDMNDPCVGDESTYQIDRLIGTYQYDSFFKSNIDNETLKKVRLVQISILSDSCGCILYNNEIINFTFTINQCYVKIKTIDSPFDLLNITNGSVFSYSADRLCFKNICCFINLDIDSIDWFKF